jgi:hypothetical protein
VKGPDRRLQIPIDGTMEPMPALSLEPYDSAWSRESRRKPRKPVRVKAYAKAWSRACEMDQVSVASVMMRLLSRDT